MMLIGIGIAVVFILTVSVYIYEKLSNERNFYSTRDITIGENVYTVYVIPGRKGDDMRAATALNRIKLDLLRILDASSGYVSRYPFRVCVPTVVKARLLSAKDTLSAKDSIGETVDSRDDDKTSYTISKSKIYMCIRHGYYRTPRDDEPPSFKIYAHDILMYPAIHEVAHMICTSIGHTSEFLELNGFLLSVARDIGISASKNFDRGVYCGMHISG